MNCKFHDRWMSFTKVKAENLPDSFMAANVASVLILGKIIVLKLMQVYGIITSMAQKVKFGCLVFC